jgi:hypothetical protein
MDGAKWALAVRERRCWVCGDPLGAYMTFVVGPMCGINRTSAEPPSHLDCAIWSARNCPFLTRPHMVRREDEAINNAALVERAPGHALTRNPGVTLLWTTRTYKVFDAGNGKPLINMGEPTNVEFYAEGRRATHAEVDASVAGGLPALLEMAQEQDAREGCGAVDHLRRFEARFRRLYQELP